MDVKNFFDAARDIAGGKLNQNQVNELNKIVDLLSKKEKVTSDIGIHLIKKFEGIKLFAYDDGVGVWTIGIGTTRYPDGTLVKKGDKCTEEQAKQYFICDLRCFEIAINKAVRVKLNQNQFDALVSLIYNIGINAFNKSTLLKKLNEQEYIGAADQFLVWNKAGGKVLTGLVERRKAEKELFLKR
ncbi:lysozyme [Acinetobacter sp. 194]|uniref:lysozyme n=1 Tax=Acinetobacter shaoyimingii TaxID=2715164 RepID=UPI00140D48CC|nr:lysozyme [Acinetobacter shaoyimingii]NHB59552.1 lysozyme [Acinetobacter shaoyimingii]